jgi:hypothetical protein
MATKDKAGFDDHWGRSFELDDLNSVLTRTGARESVIEGRRSRDHARGPELLYSGVSTASTATTSGPASPGGLGLGRGGSDCLTAHWGWIPARE